MKLSDMDKIPTYKKHFAISLFATKMILLVFLIMVTIVYQIKFANNELAKTFFNEQSTAIKIIMDAIQTGFFAALTVVFIIYNRGGSINKYMPAIISVFGIFTLFGLAQEGSGLNRYLSKHDIENGKGHYATKEETKKELLNHEGDPFIVAVSYTSMVLIGFVLLFFVGKMVMTTIEGFNLGNNAINKESGGPGVSNFIIEVIIVSGLIALSPILSVWIRGEEYTKMNTLIVPGVFFILTIIIQLMFQYNGLLEFGERGKDQTIVENPGIDIFKDE